MSKYRDLAILAFKDLEVKGVVPDSLIARSIGNNVYDVPTKFGGYAERCFVDDEGYLLPSNMRPERICKDHRINRQYGGRMIVNMTDPSIEKIQELIENELCVVNYVRASTNAALSHVQNKKEHAGKPWQEQYSLANVDYVPVKGKRDAYVYFIDGVYYPNRAEVLSALNIDTKDLARRCASKKMPNWVSVSYKDYIAEKEAK